MKKSFSLVLLFFVIIFAVHGQPSFTRGVNLTGWFQTSSARQIQFTKFTKTDFENIKSLGCDVIRLPINLFYMTSGKPDYTVDPLFFDFLDDVIDWAEELQIYLIIDNHSTDDIASKNPDLTNALQKVWSQIASRYKNRSKYVLYEIMNEPNGMSTQNWGAIQQQAIDAIRSVDTIHYIVVGASNYNTYNDLSLLPQYTDKKLIYTFHFYDPFLFTHQGATWVTPSLAPLANMPFPYRSEDMPVFPTSLKGTWVESSYNNYQNDGTVAKVQSLIDKAVTFKNTRNVPVYCGEFGVYMINSNDSDRVYWYRQVREYLEQNNIPWTIWDYQGGFGLFKKGSDEMFNYDLNIPLLEALGFNIPPQDTFQIKPDSIGFDIYTDYIGAHIQESSYANGAKIDFYSDLKPNNGKYCIQWVDAAQYGSIGFNFVPNKDLSYLVENNYAISMLVRGNTPAAKFEIRFIDTKTDIHGDHPWRMSYTIDESLVGSWDGKWHKIYIPLKNFIDAGSWDSDEQKWYNPIGAYDWSAVDRFEIVSEYGSLTNKYFWFDNIIITNIDSATIIDTSKVIIPTQITHKYPGENLDIFPNPISANSVIQFELSEKSDVELGIYTLTGQQIKRVHLAGLNAGQYQLPFNHFNIVLINGVYICKLRTYKSQLTSIIIVK